jgi:hypothetical protein
MAARVRRGWRCKKGSTQSMSWSLNSAQGRKSLSVLSKEIVRFGIKMEIKAKAMVM